MNESTFEARLRNAEEMLKQLLYYQNLLRDEIAQAMLNANMIAPGKN